MVTGREVDTFGVASLNPSSLSYHFLKYWMVTSFLTSFTKLLSFTHCSLAVEVCLHISSSCCVFFRVLWLLIFHCSFVVLLQVLRTFVAHLCTRAHLEALRGVQPWSYLGVLGLLSSTVVVRANLYRRLEVGWRCWRQWLRILPLPSCELLRRLLLRKLLCNCFCVIWVRISCTVLRLAWKLSSLGRL